LSEKEELKIRLQDMDEAITQASNTGKADFVMRTEIDHLKQDLYEILPSNSLKQTY
jgi:protein HOOK3